MAEVSNFILDVQNNTNVDPSGGGGLLRFFEGYPWRFIVTDLQLKTTTWAQGLWADRSVLKNLNQSTVIQGAVHPDDFRVNGIFDDFYRRVAQSNRIVWAWRRDSTTQPVWNLRAAGILMTIDDQADSDVPLTRLTAYDPWKYLEARPCMNSSGALPPSNVANPGFNYLNVPGNQVALDLLTNTINNEGGVFIDAGLAHGGSPFYGGTIETTDNITLNVNSGQSVADIWNQLVSGGNMDIILTPIWDPNRWVINPSTGNKDFFTHELNIYKLAGSYRPNARFSWDRLNKSTANIDRMHDATPGQFLNKVNYYSGQGGFPVGVQVNSAAVAAFGSYWAMQFFPSDFGSSSGVYTLDLAKQALELAKQGARTVTITTVPERSPIPLIAYDIGDYVPIYASDHLRATIDGYERVQTIPITIDDNGIETVRGLIVSPDWRGSTDPTPTGPPQSGVVEVISPALTDARNRPPRRVTRTQSGLG